MLLYRHQPPATPYMYNAEANRKLAWNKTLIRYHRLDDATMFRVHTESFYEFISFQPCSHHSVWAVCVHVCVCTRECMLFSFCSFRYKCGVFIVVWLTRKSNHHKKGNIRRTHIKHTHTMSHATSLRIQANDNKWVCRFRLVPLGMEFIDFRRLGFFPSLRSSCLNKYHTHRLKVIKLPNTKHQIWFINYSFVLCIDPDAHLLHRALLYRYSIFRLKWWTYSYVDNKLWKIVLSLASRIVTMNWFAWTTLYS